MKIFAKECIYAIAGTCVMICALYADNTALMEASAAGSGEIPTVFIPVMDVNNVNPAMIAAKNDEVNATIAVTAMPAMTGLDTGDLRDFQFSGIAGNRIFGITGLGLYYSSAIFDTVSVYREIEINVLYSKQVTSGILLGAVIKNNNKAYNSSSSTGVPDGSDNDNELSFGTGIVYYFAKDMTADLYVNKALYSLNFKGVPFDAQMISYTSAVTKVFQEKLTVNIGLDLTGDGTYAVKSGQRYNIISVPAIKFDVASGVILNNDMNGIAFTAGLGAVIVQRIHVNLAAKFPLNRGMVLYGFTVGAAF